MDTKGQIDIGQSITFVVGIAVVVLLIAFLLPSAMGAFYDGSERTYNQSVGETVTLTGNLNATLDSVDDVAGEINVTVADGTESQSLTNIAEGANATATINGDDIVVTNENVTSASSAEVNYAYPSTYGWGDGPTSLFNILPLLILLAAFLFIVGIAISAYKNR